MWINLNYLRGLVDEPAKSCIAGFALTSAKYKSAVEILKRVFEQCMEMNPRDLR